MPAVICGEQIQEIVHLIENTTYSNHKVAELAGVSHVTVASYRKKVASLGVSFTFLETLDALEVQQLFHPNYPYRQSNKVAIPFEEYRARLNINKGKKGAEKIKHCHQDNQEKHGEDADCRSGFYKKTRDELRGAGDETSMPQDYHPGEVFFVDYVGPTIQYGSNDEFTANFIGSCFGHSLLVGYEATDYQKNYDWCSYIQSSFKAAGGVTIRVVHDNTKALVTTPKPNLKLNPVYKLMSKWHKFKPWPTPRYSPTFNALAENSVKIFETDILPELLKRHFDTLEEINTFIRKLTDKINSRIITGDSESRLDKFLRDEVPALLPYPDKDFPFPLQVRNFKVPRTWRFKQDGIPYQIPHTPGVTRVTLLVREDEIEVKSGSRTLCIHKKLKRGEKPKVNPNHLDEKYQKYYIENEAYFVDWASKLSPSAVELVKAQFNGVSTPDYVGREVCLNIQKLCVEGKEKAFIDACDFIANYGEFNYEALEIAMSSNAAHIDNAIRCMDMLDQIERDEMNNRGDSHVH